MSAMKINKLILSVLMAGVIFMVINVAVDVIFPEQKLEKTVYPVPAIEPAAEAADAVVTAAESIAEPEVATAAEETVETVVEKAEPATPAVAEKTAEPVVAAATPEAAVEKAEPVSPLAALLARADPERGKKVAKKCVACHTVNRGGKKKLGPNLWGVVGAKQAAREGFKYSRALAGLGGAWSYADLDAFLASPKTYAPGTRMGFPGVKKPADRAALIAYLRTLADTPPPLPKTE